MREWERQARTSAAVFTEFAPSRFEYGLGAPSASLAIAGPLKDLRKQLRAQCPPAPGVYGFIDPAGRLIYVGVSTRLRMRLITYFQEGSKDRKERRVAGHAARLVWDVVGHELLAKVRELELIRHHQPEYNVQGRSLPRESLYILLTKGDAPRFRVAPDKSAATKHAWGPLPRNRRLRDAVDRLNIAFRLRDCKQATAINYADQGELFPVLQGAGCLRGELGTCLAPCNGGCTRKSYHAQVNAARALLNGRSLLFLERMKLEMQQAAQTRQFEKALRLRDTIVDLEFLCEQTRWLREPNQPRQGVYQMTCGERPLWVVLAGGAAVWATSPPTCKRTHAKFLRQADAYWRHDETGTDRIDWPAAQIMAGWFRDHPDERAAFHSPDQIRAWHPGQPLATPLAELSATG